MNTGPVGYVLLVAIVTAFVTSALHHLWEGIRLRDLWKHEAE